MASKIQVIKKRTWEDNENEDNPQKIRKKRKVAEEIWQNQHQTELLSEDNKPCLSAQVFGEDSEIGYDQLYEFLKCAALGKHQNATGASWCRLHCQERLAGVVVLVLHDVSQLHFYHFYMEFKYLRKIFRHRFSLPPLSDDFMDKLCGAGRNSNQQTGQQEMQEDPIIQKYGEDQHGLSSYILTPEEMRLNGYPQEGNSNCSHFVSTDCNDPVTDSSPLFGLDCEMCLTEKGYELTRISVVDSSGRCIMNQLVKPKLPIKNYLTRFSGITKKLLRPVTTRLADVQGWLKKLLPHNAVLVGHSLNFDLHALEMVHPSVIDTSLLFAREGGQKFKLKFLAEAILGKKIQNKGTGGHDPTEDASCALELAQYFINQGPRKVAELNLEARLLVERTAGDSESCASSLKQKNGMQKMASQPIQCCLDILQSIGQKTLLLGGHSEASSDSCPTDVETLNKQVFQRALEEIPQSAFSIVQFALHSRHSTSDLVAEIGAKMRTKLASMLTLYAGPFGRDVDLKSLKRIFEKFGHIQSIRLTTETFQPHICIQYEALEAAQLAIESLNGAEVAGSLIKVQRPVTEIMLDCESLIKELEADPDNEGVIYLAGLEKVQSQAHLQEQLGYLKDLKSVFLPKDPRSRSWRNYCFLKFQTGESASSALKTIADQATGDHKLYSRKAFTPTCLRHWVYQVNQNGKQPTVPQPQHEAHLQEKEQLFAVAQDLKKTMKTFDGRIGKLYRCLPNHTLYVILLPGTNRVPESLPGLGLLEIKE